MLSLTSDLKKTLKTHRDGSLQHGCTVVLRRDLTRLKCSLNYVNITGFSNEPTLILPYSLLKFRKLQLHHATFMMK